MADYDTIVVGAGHNGLVCAAYLARAGQRVLVLEAASEPGGAARTREFSPGFRVSACAHVLHQFSHEVERDLALERHGLRFAARSMPTTVLSPQGDHLTLRGSVVHGAGAVDTAAYAAFHARTKRFAALLLPILQHVPPLLGSGATADRIGLFRIAWQVRKLGRPDMRELLRILGMNVYDLAEEHFESALLRAAVAFDAVLGGGAGPRAPGTVLALLYRLAAEQAAGARGMAQPLGGMGSVAASLAASAQRAGAEIRVRARVAKCRVENDQVSGVVLVDGEVLTAQRVVSSADPRTTFFELLGAEHLDTGFVRRVRNHRARGAAAKLHLALVALPTFHGIENEALRGRLILAPSPDDVDLASNPAKYGELPQTPIMEITLPSVADPALAPPDQHVLSAIVQYVPFSPKAGWETERPRLLNRILEAIAVYAPDIRERVIAAELLVPDDIEQQFGMTGGHWHHGELAMDQFLFMRPVAGAAQYAAPVPGLYLCGAGSHPGGGVTGMVGRNAAREILRHAA